MKLSIYVFVVQVLALNLLLASHTKGQKTQSVKDAVVSVNLSKASLSDIFSYLESVSDYHFNYNGIDINTSKKLDLDFRNARFSDVLLEISKKHQLGFRQLNDVIQVVKYSQIKQEEIAEMIMADVEISGKITDENGEELPGASVVVKGTTEGTTSDINGNYKLSVPEGAIITVSFVGYRTQELIVGSRSVIDVLMELDAEQLEEVVVVGYGTQKKSTLTGAVSTIGQEDIQRRTVSNSISSLQGVVPGLVVTRNSGNPGREGLDFEIRGASSLNAPNPLIIVDGVPYSSMSAFGTLNPNDIESVSVLKDASAAIYGARAAGGVVLIETKKGQLGRPTINYTAKVTLKKPGLAPHGLSRSQYYQMYEEMFANDGITDHRFLDNKEFWLNGCDGCYVQPGEYPGQVDWTFFDHDFTDYGLRNKVDQSHNLSISGSTARSNYFASVGYVEDNGIIAHGENFYKRINARLNHTFDITERLTIQSSIMFENGRQVEPAQIGKMGSRWWNVQPATALATPNGNAYSPELGPKEYWWFLKLGGETERPNYRVNTKLELNYNFTDNLKFTGIVGNNYWTDEVTTLSKTITWYTYEDVPARDNPNRNSFSKRYNKTLYNNYTGYLNYSRMIGTDHAVDVMAGGSYEKNNYDWFSAQRYDLITEQLQSLNLGATEEQFNNGGGSHWAIASYYGRLNYSFKEKYLLEGNLRYDGSSRFTGNSRWATFGGVSAGWIVSSEEFAKGLGFIDLLKLRTSFGTLGNQSGIGLYDYIQSININSNPYPFGTTGSFTGNASLGSLASQDRTWERVKTLNFGVDINTLGSRLSLSLDYYIKRNKNMLIPVTYPSVLGTAAPETNSGDLKTWGWDAMIEWKDNLGEVNYFVRAIISDNQNELIDLKGDDNVNIGRVHTREGYPINSYFGYVFDGLLKNQAEFDEYTQLDGVPGNLRLGDARYADVDGSGTINPFPDEENGLAGDLVYLGNSNIRYSYSLNLGLNWKNFDFALMLQGQLKQSLLRGGSQSRRFRAWWENQNEYFWKKPWHPVNNPEGTWPALSSRGNVTDWNYNASTADYSIYNNNYMRVKNLTLGYTLPIGVINKINLQRARVFVSSDDMFEIYPVKDGHDPEHGGDPVTYPYVRRFSLGLDITL